MLHVVNAMVDGFEWGAGYKRKTSPWSEEGDPVLGEIHPPVSRGEDGQVVQLGPEDGP